MALSQTRDVTDQFNAQGYYVADASNWDYLIWQIMLPTSTIEFYCTNNSGAISGITDGSSISASDFVSASFLNLLSNAYETSVAASTVNMFRSDQIGQFVMIASPEVGATASKIIVQYHKIS
jgi:hypothetical protein